MFEQDHGLSEAEVAAAVPYQRIAAYAVVRSSRGVLMTELSDRTNAAGMWNLPGGGLDARLWDLGRGGGRGGGQGGGRPPTPGGARAR